MGSRTESESEREIWKAMEVAEGARGDNSSSHVLQSASLTLDTSLSLPDLTPPLMFVSFTSLSLFFLNKKVRRRIIRVYLFFVLQYQRAVQGFV